MGPPEPIHLIVNERAGRGRGARAGEAAFETLLARGARVVRTTTEGPGHAAVLARRARDEGAAIVAAVGGDGTLHEVLNGLLGAELLEGQTGGPPCPALGSIPVGSGNDYVKMLGVSRSDPRVAAQALLDGTARPVDVGILEGAAPRAGPGKPELFLNNLGLAFTGEANARIDATRGLPGGMAYFLGAAMAFFSYVPPLMSVEVDGRPVYTGRPTIVHVNLGRFCGGGVLFTPDAELDDGLFDVLVLGELTHLECVVRWKAITSGAGRTMPDVAIFRARSVVVRGPEGGLLHADGEVRRFAGRAVVARVAPRAIRVIHAPALVGVAGSEVAVARRLA